MSPNTFVDEWLLSTVQGKTAHSELDPGQWAKAVGLAQEQGLAPLLYAALRNQMSPVQLSSLQDDYYHSSATNSEELAEFADLAGESDAAGIPFAALRGLALMGEGPGRSSDLTA